MSFRKRGTVISSAQPSTGAATPLQVESIKTKQQLLPGLRPSPLDGRLTTSTGTSSLDHLLAGHVGLPLGTCLLVEEQGTTDFAGVLLRYYAAEGLVQGHKVHAVGFSQAWRSELPALAAEAKGGKSSRAAKAPLPEDKIKIAWRYEAFGNTSTPAARPDYDPANPFCHSFDLTKRLAPASCKGSLEPIPMEPLSLNGPTAGASYPFKRVMAELQARLASSGPDVVHRLVVPSLLAPSIYPPACARPSNVLQFLHALRALLRQYSTQLTAVVTLPVSLFPRSLGVTRWMELLADGVVELIPLPSQPSGGERPDAQASEHGQGLLRVHSLPVYHEKGGGGAENTYFREDLTFSLSGSRGLVIKPYSLPPLGEEDQKEKSPASTVKDGMDF